MSNIFVRLKLYHILEAIFLHKATDLTSTNNGPVLDVSFCRVGIRCQNPPKSARFHHLSRGPVDYIDIYVPALAGHGYISKLFVKPTKKQKKTSRFFFYIFRGRAAQCCRSHVMDAYCGALAEHTTASGYGQKYAGCATAICI